MTGMLAFDDTVARTIETMYTTADVVEQRRVVLALRSPRRARPRHRLRAGLPGRRDGPGGRR